MKINTQTLVKNRGLRPAIVSVYGGHQNSFGSNSLCSISESIALHPAAKVLKLKTIGALVFMSLCGVSSTVLADTVVLPTGFNSVHGDTSVVYQGNKLNIQQSSAKAIAEWSSFDISKGGIVDLKQPLGGMALYRILSNQGSVIQGQLNATGQLFLINPNGVIFSKSAQVNVGSIVVSTLNIKNEDFLQNHFAFERYEDQHGAIINRGKIKANDEGYVVLLGETVKNSGTITAKFGSVVMASAQQAFLDFYGNGLLHAVLKGDAAKALLQQDGHIQAEGGLVQLATRARSAALNMTGIIEAHQLVERNGEIRLEAGDTGTVMMSGKLDVSSQDTTGGTVKVLGEHVALLDGSEVNASGTYGGGTILVGGNYQGQGPEQNAQATFVAKSAKIMADATQSGDGGTVITWGTDMLQMHGLISAQGGVQGGNGGFVETSSHGDFYVSSAPDVGARHGIAGTWLLDPYDLVIKNSGQNSIMSGSSMFTPTGSGAVIEWSTINAGLTTGNVKVTTVTAGGNEAGNITVAEKGVLSGTHDLTLDAANKIVLKADIDTKGGLLLQSNGVETSGNRILTAGGKVESNANIITNGGALTITATKGMTLNDINTTSTTSVLPPNNTVSGRVILISNAVDATIKVGQINTSGGVNGDGGSVSISANGQNSAIITGAINTSAGTQVSNSNGRNSGSVNIRATGQIDVESITANANDANGNMKSGGTTGVVNLRSSADSVRVGAINLIAGKGSQGGADGVGQTVRILAKKNVTLLGDITGSSTETDFRLPSVLINAEGNFYNPNNSNISTPGRWLVYSTRPDLDTKGLKLSNQAKFIEYGRVYDPLSTLAPTHDNISGSAQSGFLYAYVPTITNELVGTTSKPFDGNTVVTNPASLQTTTTVEFSAEGDRLNGTVGGFNQLAYDTPQVGTNKSITANFTTNNYVYSNTTPAAGTYYVNYETDSGFIPVYGYKVQSINNAKGIITGGILPRDGASLGTLPTTLNLLSGLTLVPLNPPAAGNEDEDYVPCIEPVDKIGRTPVLDSGIKMPDSVIATCI